MSLFLCIIFLIPSTLNNKQILPKDKLHKHLDNDRIIRSLQVIHKSLTEPKKINWLFKSSWEYSRQCLILIDYWSIGMKNDQNKHLVFFYFESIDSFTKKLRTEKKPSSSMKIFVKSWFENSKNLYYCAQKIKCQMVQCVRHLHVILRNS